MTRKTVLFDLDGTLTDPGLGITNAILYAFREMGLPQVPREELYPYIGPPLVWSFQTFAKMALADAKRAADHYRDYYQAAGKLENQVYPGIPEALQALRRRGCRTLVATSKPEPTAIEILEFFHLAPYFDGIAGSCSEGTVRLTKGEVLAYALDRYAVEPAAAVMVGDRLYDVAGAKEHGLPCIGVLYGYGSREELLKAGAAALAETPKEIIRCVEAL